MKLVRLVHDLVLSSVYATIVLPTNELQNEQGLQRVRASFKASMKRLGGQEVRSTFGYT